VGASFGYRLPIPSHILLVWLWRRGGGLRRPMFSQRNVRPPLTFGSRGETPRVASGVYHALRSDRAPPVPSLFLPDRRLCGATGSLVRFVQGVPGDKLFALFFLFPFFCNAPSLFCIRYPAVRRGQGFWSRAMAVDAKSLRLWTFFLVPGPRDDRRVAPAPGCGFA